MTLPRTTAPPDSPEAAEAVLARLGAGPDVDFDLTACALACAVHEAPERDITAALDTLDSLEAGARAANPLDAEGLARLLWADFGFEGAREDYDNPANADLVSILERRRGLPVGLGLVWLHVARLLGLPLWGADTPGHFLLRLDQPGGELPVLIDAFEGGALVDGAGLVRMARAAGLKSLEPRHLAAMPDRRVALRLQNNLANRARANGDLQAWVRAERRRALICPDDPQIALERAAAAAAANLMMEARASAMRALDLARAQSDAEPWLLAEGERLLGAFSRSLN